MKSFFVLIALFAMFISTPILCVIVDRPALERALVGACADGAEDQVRQLVSILHTIGGPGTDTRIGRAAVTTACDHGHLQVAQWIAAALVVRELPIMVGGVLSHAARRGDAAVVRWLITEFETPMAIVSDIFADACAGGNLEIVQGLVCIFALTVDAVRLRACRVLRLACEAGHLSVAEWLGAHFELTTSDARAQSDYALRFACANGHLGVAQWLVERFGLDARDARTHNCAALRDACANGHLATAKWLVEIFGLAEHVRDGDDHALRGACLNDHLATVQWLVGTFNITTATDGLRSYLRHANCPSATPLGRFVRRTAPPNASARWLTEHLRNCGVSVPMA